MAVKASFFGLNYLLQPPAWFNGIPNHLGAGVHSKQHLEGCHLKECQRQRQTSRKYPTRGFSWQM
jgi:hypothetical protein